MTNLSAMNDQLPQSTLPSHSYDKLGSSAFPTSAVSLSYHAPHSTTAVHHEGGLHKRSSILKQWHSSYYVLDDLTLVTYPSQQTYQQVASSPPSPSSHQYKRVDLSDFSVRSLSPSAHNRPYCFALQSRDTGKELLFAAPSEQGRTAWIDALNKAVRAAGAAKRDRANSKSKDRAGSEQAQENGEKSELVSGAAHGRREEVMSGKGHGLYSNALITSSSSSSLASITHNMSASTSSNSLSSASDVCHSCHSPFTPQLRAVHCTRCARSFCDGCAANTVTVRGGEVDEDRRVCNRCHEGMGLVGSAGALGAETSGLGGSRMTTRNGMADEADEVNDQHIVITVGAPTNLPALTVAASNALLPPLPPLHTSTSSSESHTVFITNPAVEATRELISPAPNPSSPPPSPLSPIHVPSHLISASRPASPTTASNLASPSYSSYSRPGPPLRLLTVKVPETRERDIQVLSREEIERLEAERKRKGLPDPGARMGSVVVGAPQKPAVVAAAPKQPTAAAKQVRAGGEEQPPQMKKPWYVCGCGM